MGMIGSMSVTRTLPGGDPPIARVTAILGGAPRLLREVPDANDWLDEIRVRSALDLPGPTHQALARLQHALGPERCTLATTAIDGMLLKASAEHVLELCGSVFYVRCSGSDDHGQPPVSGLVAPRRGRCRCGAELRPDVIAAAEPYRWLPALEKAVRASTAVVVVDVEPGVTRRVVAWAKEGSARIWGFGRTKVVGVDVWSADPPEEGLPSLVAAWLREEP